AFVGGPIPAPQSLSAFKLAEGTGFGGDVLYYDDNRDDNRFTIRCDDKDTPTAPAECLRYIQISPDIALEYRYRIGLLEDWSRIEAAVIKLYRRLKQENKV
ncbi:MAG: hypothetical protein K8F25_11510, partial [Fimbriimonadaceae bacterium]|nr:hypothetical protein [Alphaproteobacteria bacterium]